MLLPKSSTCLANACFAALWLATSVPAFPQGWEPYLSGYHGPYRGRVINAETKAPIPGAAVVAVWATMKEDLSQATLVFYEAREAVTDETGSFLLNAADIETAAPPNTLRPTFVIFYPGYGSFPEYQVTPQGTVGGIFEGGGTTVEVATLNTSAERLAVLGGLPVAPAEKIPNLVRLIDIERINLKLKAPE